jgi:hypothetical protein
MDNGPGAPVGAGQPSFDAAGAGWQCAPDQFTRGGELDTSVHPLSIIASCHSLAVTNATSS